MKKGFAVLAITLIALTASAALTQYEVHEAVNATIAQDDSIAVRGVVSVIEFYPNEFVDKGSVYIYLKDATGTDDEFDLERCYALDADTFKTSSPAFNPKSKNLFGVNSVTSKNGTVLHVGDTVVAVGKYFKDTEAIGLQADCYLTSIVKGPNAVEPETETIVFKDGYIDGIHYADYQVLELYLTNIPIDPEGYLVGDGDFLFLTFYPESDIQPEGTFTVDDMTLDPEYCMLERDNGADTTLVSFSAGVLKLTVIHIDLEEEYATLKIEASLTGDEDNKTYLIDQTLEIGYYLYEEEPEEGIQNTNAITPNNVAIKAIENGHLILKVNNTHYNLNGAVVK
ncbi:MAG: hypothetical protein IJQ95_02460 [Paludibacteraceae bacterium]|nr:hypothetical protein [Paludibacteraceae bacterium]